MQHKALVYVVGLVAVAILGAGAWLIFSKGTFPGSLPTQAPETQNTTLKNLMAMSGSHQCTFLTATAQTSSSGTVYIANGQLRGDFSSFVAGQTTKSHMIVKDATSYVWTDASTEGFKLAFEAVATQSDATPQATVDPNAQVEYACSTWTPDEGLFVLPTTVTFRDMSDLIPKGNSGAGASGGASVGGTAAQCAVCEKGPDAQARAQCRAILKCQ